MHGTIQTPEWFFCEKYDARNAKVDKETMKKEWKVTSKSSEFLREKYPGVVYAWDVVNEACDDGGGYRTSVCGMKFTAMNHTLRMRLHLLENTQIKM